MSETIAQYFRRFDNSITQSLYSAITLEDFQRNKASMEYLDYDRQTLFQRNKGYCGIRNVGNSCYLSVTLQILFNVQPLREKIFIKADLQSTEFLVELQKLFALMLKGSLVYVDPTNLFLVLKKLHPDVFVDGLQNDFHEVYTLILEELQKSFTQEDDKRFFKKMFYGRMKAQIVDEKKNVVSGVANDADSSFNLLNLGSENKTFDSALKKFKSENIEEYKNDQGEKMKVLRETNFLETPALLSFFINRVTFKNNKLVKDSSQFDFEQKILFSKTTNTKVNKTVDGQIEKQINALKQWIKTIEMKKEHILQTLSYLDIQQFNDIHIPSLINPNGSQAKENTKKYLKSQVEQIGLNITQCQAEIIELEHKRMKQAEENNTQVYYLWAVMIHYGSTANSGHYKICIKANTSDNKWIEFNDRKSQEVTNDKVIEYKKKGEICCLFYRRNALQSHVQKTQITSSLKKYVQQKEQQIFKEIDNARILQALYQEYESINIMWDHQNLLLRQQERISTYFFKPLLHLLLKQTGSQKCKGFLLYESIKNEKFIQNMKNRLIDQNRQIKIPNLSASFGLPSEYESLSEALKQFICLEVKNPVEAYERISFCMDVTVTDKILSKYFTYLKQVLLLKGVFYESMFLDKNLYQKYEEFSKLMNKMVTCLEQDDPCTVILVVLRTAIREKYLNKIIKNSIVEKDSFQISLRKLPSVAFSSLLQAGPQIFRKSFGFWIEQRQNIGTIDESILDQYKKYYRLYFDQ